MSRGFNTGTAFSAPESAIDEDIVRGLFADLAAKRKSITPSSAGRLSRMWAKIGPLNGIAPQSAEELRNDATQRFHYGGASGEQFKELRRAKAWGRATGYSPLGMDLTESINPTILRHEQIHSVHMANYKHPFFQQKVRETQPLARLLEDNARQQVFDWKGKELAPDELDRMARGFAKRMKGSYAAQYHALNKEDATATINSEKLAYSHQANEAFMSDVKRAGIGTFDDVANSLRVSNATRRAEIVAKASHIAPGRSISEIEGLAHGGLAAVLRKAVTAFGSGWRGIVSLPGSIANPLIGQGNAAMAVMGMSEFRVAANNPAIPANIRKQFHEAIAWSERTGFKPILVNRDAPGLAASGYSGVSRIIRHERIHQAHLAQVDNPFFEKELSRTGDLPSSLQKAYADMAKLARKKGYLHQFTEADLSAQVEAAAAQQTAVYKASFVGHANPALMEDTERLAQSYQMDSGFFQRMKAAGVRDPRIPKIRQMPGVVEAVMASGKSNVAAGTGWWSKLARGARKIHGV